MPKTPTFGKIIRTARKRAGLSQKDLAAKVVKFEGGSISAQYMNDIEHDRRSPPCEFMIRQLADVLDLHKWSLIMAAGIVPIDLYTSVRSLFVQDGPRLERALELFRREVE